MSIEALIQAYEGHELCRIYPRRRRGSTTRTLHVLRDINDFCVVGPSGVAIRNARSVRVAQNLWVAMGADLIQFADGRELAVRRADATHDGDEQSNIARLYPDEEVWEIRVQQKRDGLHLFGRFWEKDKFVGLLWGYKGHNDQLLTPAQYHTASRGCRDVWDRMFNNAAPHTGVHPDAYLHRTRPVPR